MKYFSYLNTAGNIINLYRGQQPFHVFIKDFFRQQKKYGSTDRKQITQLCYCWFRLGSALEELPPQERMLTALFLCTNQPSPVLAHTKPQWNEKLHLPVEEKCTFLNIPAHALPIFPAVEEIGDGIDKTAFILSHFNQPDVFLRVRPGCTETVLQKLRAANISFSLLHDNCISTASTAKIDTVLDINREVVVQDYSSQRTGDLLEPLARLGLPVKVWDCCAASGGKSLMAKDILVDIDLTASDIRKKIIDNLVERFEQAGIRDYKTLILDLTLPGIDLPRQAYQLIIADLPCTGSGTWGRSPERLVFFDKKEIDRYAALQQKIISNVWPCLQEDGFFLYITCSVFKKENEDMVDYIQQHCSVDLLQSVVIKGYDMKADTMFAAMFRKKRL